MAGALNRRWLLQPGDTLNNTYQIDRPLGHGGMGEVYLGHSLALDEDVVAIKVILPEKATDEDFRQLFGREARALLRVRHPNIVGYRSFSHDLDLDLHYIVTDFVEGENLADRLKQGPISRAEFDLLARAIIEGLRAVHETGIIHRDFAPDNVILEGGDLSKPKIIDFGVVKDTSGAMPTIVGDNVVGKMNFMAPEQLGKPKYDVGPWTDVYSLGLGLLAAYRGDPADMGGSFADAIDKRQRPVDLSGVDPRTRAFLDRLLQTHPEDRPQSMAEVLELLHQSQAGETIFQPAPPVVAETPPVVDESPTEPEEDEKRPPKPAVAVPLTKEQDAIPPPPPPPPKQAPPPAPPPPPSPPEPSDERTASEPLAEGPIEQKGRSKGLLLAGGLAGLLALGAAGYGMSSLLGSGDPAAESESGDVAGPLATTNDDSDGDDTLTVADDIEEDAADDDSSDPAADDTDPMKPHRMSNRSAQRRPLRPPSGPPADPLPHHGRPTW